MRCGAEIAHKQILSVVAGSKSNMRIDPAKLRKITELEK
jgi:hypothetical protein